MTYSLTPSVRLCLLGLGLWANRVAAASSAGCERSQAVEVGQTINVTLDNRWYLLYFPENYEPTSPAPLILSYHGGNRNASEQQTLDLLSTPFFNEDYIVVYPNGIDERWQGVPGVVTDDLGFTTGILDDLEEQYCIDTNRIFATGKSDGGGFVGVLACDEDLSSRIAAFAPVSGAFYIANTTGNTCDPETIPYNPDITPAKTCTPSRVDIPMLEFHGKADKTISYTGGVRRKACLPTILHWIETWAVRDGLGSTKTSSEVPNALEGSTAIRYEFGNGSAQGLVSHIMDGTNIGHDWPSTILNDDAKGNGDPAASFNASSLIIDFFAAHPLSS
ncbi:hypothetical protein N0V93_009473 [Gnomoniopsis smithogilvyi]|uniref:feruloyl esterase n=1 Tax=Gnomoniopsis smithogilvyi TaxID=1191159 RepID=A0A9W9CSQ9_9PEZI|nr:hypothetical protein N0V93_009473 [Gnomoniopsis smithogilvyi]